MDSQQKKQTAPTKKAQGGATSSRQEVEKPAATSSVAKPNVREITSPTTTAAQNPTATTPAPTPDTIPLSQLEQLLKQIQPNLDMAKTLATLSQPQENAPPTPIVQPTPATPVVGTEEVANEWFDAEAGGATPVAEQDAEEVYSGATEVLGEDDEEEMGDDAGSKPIQTEVMTVGTEMVKAGELNREEEVENPTGCRIEDVVIVPDDDEENREEQSKEDFGQGVSGQEEGPPRNVVGDTGRRRRLLIDEASEEEEEEVPFQPIGGPLSPRQPLREGALVDRAGQLDVPTERAAGAEERERLERLKRKGKQIAKPVKKKARQASTTVVIRESRSERAVVPQEEESNEDEALR